MNKQTKLQRAEALEHKAKLLREEVAAQEKKAIIKKPNRIEDRVALLEQELSRVKDQALCNHDYGYRYGQSGAGPNHCIKCGAS